MIKLTGAIAILALVVSSISTLALGLGARSQAARLDDLAALVATLEDRLDEEGAIDRASPIAAVGERWDQLEHRIERLETTPRRTAVIEAVASPTEAEEAGDNLVPEPAATPTDAAARTELCGLVDAITATSFDWQTGSEELGRFFALARDSAVIDERITELEAAVQAAPRDDGQRMELANFYIAKLMTISGPEQALWGNRAEQQWQAVREQDPGHWESRFRIGNGYTYYPDAMGKTDDAIELLSEARVVQEAQSPRPEHVQTYLALARMHQRKGEHAEARAALESGRQFHPGDERLQAAIDKLPR